MDNRLDALLAERDALERGLLELERGIEQRGHLRLAAADGAAPPQTVELAERAAALLRRLGSVNDTLAALRAPGPAGGSQTT